MTTVSITDLTNAKLDVQTISEVAMVNYTDDTTTNRDGDTIYTLVGMLKQLGYIPPITYAGSISFSSTDNLKTVERSGIVYAPLPSALPFTTSTWGTDDDNFFVLQVGSTVTSASIAYDNSTSGLAATDIQDAIDELAEEKVQIRTSDLTITVGSGGDYSTINDALAFASTLRPKYASSLNNVTINLLTGFVMAEQVLVDGLDLGWVIITGADAETVITRSALTTSIQSRYPAFAVRRGGTLPYINHLFNMDSSGTATSRDGILVYGAKSSASIASGKGVKNCGAIGLDVQNGGIADCEGGVFTGCGSEAIFCSNASVVNAQSATLTGGGVYGVLCSNGGLLNIQSANAQMGGSTATTDIVCQTGSTINAGSATGGVSKTVNTITAAGVIYR